MYRVVLNKVKIMNLEQYIRLLESFDPAQKLPLGLGNPHSWRGDYYDLAFEPVENITVGEMLQIAENCIDRTFDGWKGGEYKMTPFTTIHVDYRGHCYDLGLFLLLQVLLQLPDEKPCSYVENLKGNPMYSDEPFSYQIHAS